MCPRTSAPMMALIRRSRSCPPFWVVARDKDDDDPNMELTTESESFGKGTNKLKVDVPKMVNTKALAVGDFLQVAPWPRLQPRPAKKPRTT